MYWENVTIAVLIELGVSDHKMLGFNNLIGEAYKKAVLIEWGVVLHKLP